MYASQASPSKRRKRSSGPGRPKPIPVEFVPFEPGSDAIVFARLPVMLARPAAADDDDDVAEVHVRYAAAAAAADAAAAAAAAADDEPPHADVVFLPRDVARLCAAGWLDAHWVPDAPRSVSVLGMSILIFSIRV